MYPKAQPSEEAAIVVRVKRRLLPLLWLFGGGCLGLLGCETQASLGAHPQTGVAGAQAQDAREPAFASPRSRPVYERAAADLAAMNALRGTPMTEGFATDLGFKCSALREAQKGLVGERDPLVVALVARIDKTCNFDVPLASALFELQRIMAKRAADPGADLKHECAGLRLAIGDVGSRYVENPRVVDVIGQDVSYCGSTDTVRVVPAAP
jgi:hypothetical protein